MKRIDFNNGWKYRRAGGNESWKEVTIPHDAMISERRTADSAGGINTGWFEGYDYVYEKTFEVPEEMKENEVSFEFEGVYHNAEVYINDRKAGFRPYGYTNFYVEADPYLKYGEENVIRVIAHNADQPNSRWYSGAGIYRPVWMDVFSKQHIQRNGIRIRTVSAEPPVIEVEVQTTAAGELELEVLETGVTANVETNGDAVCRWRFPAENVECRYAEFISVKGKVYRKKRERCR